MKIPVIKQLVERCTEAQLREAEADILEGREPKITDAGADAGEQLTHIMAALWIKNEMSVNKTDLNTALRAYTQKVRASIS
ncbi:MAG: hypothetical protein KatS3mg031_0559 [Chitinophagales bacterium]|nr:MAG: hypothetical protein KatS3mg031_0559 [Chitinophagales bacterium]